MQLTFNIFVFRWLSKKISPFPALSFLIFFSLFFYHSVGALRYSIIISLFLISFFIFIKSSGFLKKLTVVATATQAHLIWPVLMTFFIPRNKLILNFIVITLIFITLLKTILGIELLYLIKLIGYDPFIKKLENYTALYDYRGFIFGGEGSYFSSFVFFTFSLSIVGLIVSQVRQNSLLYYLSIFLLIGCCLKYSFIDIKIVSDRTFSLFWVLTCFSIPVIISCFKQKTFLYLCAIVLSSIWFFIIHDNELRAYNSWII